MIRFLIKGLVRDRTRSLFPAVTVVAGVALTVFLQTYITGLNSNMSDASAAFSTGHLKVVSKAAAKEGDQASNELALNQIAALLEQVRQQFPELLWTPRIRFAGLLDIPLCEFTHLLGELEGILRNGCLLCMSRFWSSLGRTTMRY